MKKHSNIKTTVLFCDSKGANIKCFNWGRKEKSSFKEVNFSG